MTCGGIFLIDHFIRLGYWSITVYGRKHCYRLYTRHFNEAVHWACAIQKIIDTKSPVETPTQLLIRDIEVGHGAHFHTRVCAFASTAHVIRTTECKQPSPPPPPPSFNHGNHLTTLVRSPKFTCVFFFLLSDFIILPHWIKTWKQSLCQN